MICFLSYLVMNARNYNYLRALKIVNIIRAPPLEKDGVWNLFLFIIRNKILSLFNKVGNK